MKVLVFGASGFIGSYVLENELKLGNKVKGTHYKPTIDYYDYKDFIPNLVKCNINNFKDVYSLIKRYKPQLIYHLAAQSFPTKSMIDPYYTLQTNIIGTTNIFEAIKKAKIKTKLVIACSSAQYGYVDQANIPVLENHIFKPLHPYGISKVCTEMLAYHYYINYNVPSVLARIFNTTGPRKRGDVCADFTFRAVKSISQKNKLIKVGNLNNLRAICDVRDTANALSLLIRKGKPGEAYNISSVKTVKVKEILKIINNNLTKPIKWKKDYKLFRKHDEKIIYGNSKKLKLHTGWKQNISINQTIFDMMEYWKKRMNAKSKI